MRQLNSRRIAGGGVAVENEDVALVQFDRAVGEQPEPQFRTLEIDQHADRPSRLLLQRPDHCDPLAHRVMRGVAHVDAEDVRPRGEQGGDRLLVGRRRTESGDDLYAAVAAEMQRLLPELKSSDGAGLTRNPPHDHDRLQGVAEFAWSVSWTVQLFASLPVSTSKKPVRS